MFQDPWEAKFESRYKYIAPEDLELHLKTEPKLTLPAQRWGLDYVVLNILGVEPTTDLSGYRVMSNVTIREVFTSMMFRRGSPLKLVLHRGLKRLVEAGIWSHWRHMITNQYKDRKELLVEKDSRVLLEPEALNVLRLESVFAMLLIGLVLSSLVFCVETGVFVFAKKKKSFGRKIIPAKDKKCCKCGSVLKPNSQRFIGYLR